MKKLLLAIAFLAFGGQAFGQVLLRQSTASTVQIYLAKTADGTGETGATVTNISLSIIKHSNTTSTSVTTVSCAASGSANDCVHVAKGAYNVELSTGNTDTLGRMDLCWSHADTYTLCRAFMVVDPASYDANVTGSLTSAAGVWAVATSGLTGAGTIGKEVADALPSAAPGAVGGLPTVDASNKIVGIQANGIDAASIAPSAIGVSEAPNLDAAVSSRASQTSLNTVDDFLDTEVAAIKTKTDNLPANTSTELTALLTSLQGSLAVRRATSFQWAFQMVTTAGVPVTTGTPACSRSLDAPGTFSATTNTPSALNSDGFSEITLSTADMTASHYVLLKCTAVGARNYYSEFKVQTP